MIHVACALIQDDSGRLLLAKRASGKSLAGFWEFPGGKVEEGEAPEDALCRELREELLIEAEVTEAMEPVEHSYGAFSIRLLPFLAKIRSGTPIPVEHSEIAWVGREEIETATLAPADVPVLAQLSR